MSATTRLYSADELAQMPSDEPWELWEGELRKVPSAGGVASVLAQRIGVLVYLFVNPRRLGLVTGADGSFVVLRNPDTVLVPDVAFVRWDRLPGRIVPTGYFPVPPDLAIDVRSPTDEPGEIARKLELYQRAEVPLVCWVNPEPRTVTVHRLGQLAVELSETDDLDGGTVLPGFRLSVAEIFVVE